MGRSRGRLHKNMKAGELATSEGLYLLADEIDALRQELNERVAPLDHLWEDLVGLRGKVEHLEEHVSTPHHGSADAPMPDVREPKPESLERIQGKIDELRERLETLERKSRSVIRSLSIIASRFEAREP